MAKPDIIFVRKQTVPGGDFVSRQGRSAARIVDGLSDFVAPRAPPMKIGNVPAHGTQDGRLAVQLIALVDCQSRKRPVAADRFWPKAVEHTNGGLWPITARRGSWPLPTHTGQTVSTKAVVRTGTNDLVGPDPRGVL